MKERRSKSALRCAGEPSAEEIRLFREAVGDVRRYQHDKIEPVMSRAAPYPLQRQRDEAQVLEEMLSDAWDATLLEIGDELLYRREGVQNSVLRRLRRGDYSVGAELDLHGMTVKEARQELARFLHGNRQRCVRIIHGKGNGSLNRRPVLKSKVNHWLQQRDEVLAFCSARSVDGGTGAVYVLLRSPR